MRPLAFAVPGSLDTPTGGYRYDRRVIADLRALGHEIRLVTLAAAFPCPTDDDRRAAEAAISVLPAGMPVIIDGLAYGVLAEESGRLAQARPLIVLVHHPLALETGIDPEVAARFLASERAALAEAHAVIVTSRTTAKTLAGHYGVPAAKITVAEPGVDRRPISAKREAGAPFRFLSVGSLTRRKGYLDLIAAYVEIMDLDWIADIVGDAMLDPDHVCEIAAAIAAHGLSSRVRLHGAIDEAALSMHYADADCFVLASRYEGYGMAYTEAIAHGLPVIGTRGGAIPEAVGSGGVLVEPGDIIALGERLRLMILDDSRRTTLREHAAVRARQFATWQDTALVISQRVSALR